MHRLSRSTIPLLAAGLLVATVGTAAPAAAAPIGDSGPPTVTPADIRFSHDTLRYGSPRQVGLIPEYVERMRVDAERYLVPTPDHPTWPTYSGAVVLAAKNGVIVTHEAVGKSRKYSAVGGAPGRIGVELPPEQQIDTRPDTIFDLASISKLFTTITFMQLVEQGRVDLDATVASYLPEFAAGGKATVTVRMLLTHTSGLPAFVPLYSRYPTPETRLAAALATPLAAGATPGTRYVYSDLGLIALGVLIERISGKSLRDAVQDAIISPLGLRDTGYNPAPELRDRIAATEDESYAGRGLVWGEVHDENAWSLGGVAGHAGLFSTAGDLAILCQMLLNGGEYAGARILRADTIRTMLVNYNAPLEAAYPESDRGLGFELNKHWYMMGLSSPVAFGHTGFTGTSIVIDPLDNQFVIFLSNRVHPDRNWGSNNVARRAMTQNFANATPVRPHSETAWRANEVDSANVTLTVPMPRATVDARLSFMLWYDIEPQYDKLRFETSADGGQTWAPAQLTLQAADGRFSADGMVTGYGGRQWWQVSAVVPDGTTTVRWRNSTDSSSRGRGVYVDRILAVDQDGLLFNGEGRDADLVVANGWTEARE